VIIGASARILHLGSGCLSYLKVASNRRKERLQREKCVAHNTARILPESSILNSLGCREAIQIGAHTVSRGECRVFNPAGSIRIGCYCYIGDHSRIWSAVGITIGDRVLISHFVNIHDNDSHPKSASLRHRQAIEIFEKPACDMTDVDMAPIVIEVMKGVTVGKGAVIGAATVITKDVPPYAIMVGNPARLVGTASE
jgi:acetyltransferase-like isoleucine patch superfamily enzyme